MITCNIENVDQYQEAIDSEFGFKGNTGVIRVNNQIVGFYKVKYCDTTEIFLDELEIVDSFRGMNFGRMFINYLFETYSQADNIYGRATLESVGFYDRIGCVYDTPEDNQAVLEYVQKLLGNEELEDENEEFRDFSIFRENFFNQKEKI